MYQTIIFSINIFNTLFLSIVLFFCLVFFSILIRTDLSKKPQGKAFIKNENRQDWKSATYSYQRTGLLLIPVIQH